MTAAASASFFCMPWEKSVTSFLLSLARLHEFEQFFGALVGCVAVRPYMRPTKRRYSGAVRRPNRAMPSGTTPIWRFSSSEPAVNGCAENFDRPGGWRQKAGEHLDGGGLPCPVGSEKAEELSLRHVQRDVVHRRQRAKAPRKAVGLNCRNCHVRPA